MSKYNLLFIFTDEQRADTLAAYGNTQIEMPNLNKLASESVVFDQAYVTQPVCTPSRSSIMTGLYPHTTGCVPNNTPLKAETPCLPELLEPDSGYLCAYYGKWHLGDEIFSQHGFTDWVGIDDGYYKYFSPERDRSTRSPYHHFLLENGFEPDSGTYFGRTQSSRLPEEYGKPAFLANEVTRFIRENKDKPFVMYVNFFEPHMPFFGPRDDQYNPEDIPLPENFDYLPQENQPLKARVIQAAHVEKGHRKVLELKTKDDWKRIIANYWGLCSLVDTHAGRILDTLEECGLKDNTIIVYTSDHGDMMGCHQMIAKCVMFEEATRVPLLVRMPGQKECKHVKGPVSQINLVPTLLDLLDQPIPDHLQGKSLKPFITGNEDTIEDDVIIEWNGPNNGILGESPEDIQIPKAFENKITKEELVAALTDPVRTIVTANNWKFNCSPLGEHELYNLDEDPGEINNLFGNPEYDSLIQDLVQRIKDWQKRTGDTVELNL